MSDPELIDDYPDSAPNFFTETDSPNPPKDSEIISFKNKEDVKNAKKILTTAMEFRSIKNKTFINKFISTISIFEVLRDKIMPDLYTHLINNIGCKLYEPIIIINKEKDIINTRFLILISGICFK